LPETTKVDAELCTILGERIRSYSLGEYFKGWNSFFIDEPNLAAGVYYLRLKIKNTIMTTKLCVY